MTCSVENENPASNRTILTLFCKNQQDLSTNAVFPYHRVVLYNEHSRRLIEKQHCRSLTFCTVQDPSACGRDRSGETRFDRRRHSFPSRCLLAMRFLYHSWFSLLSMRFSLRPSCYEVGAPRAVALFRALCQATPERRRRAGLTISYSFHAFVFDVKVKL